MGNCENGNSMEVMAVSGIENHASNVSLENEPLSFSVVVEKREIIGRSCMSALKIESKKGVVNYDGKWIQPGSKPRQKVAWSHLYYSETFLGELFK